VNRSVDLVAQRGNGVRQSFRARVEVDMPVSRDALAERSASASRLTERIRTMNPLGSPLLARRWFLQQCGVGLGSIALTHLLHGDGYAAPVPDDQLAPKKPQTAAKAKRVIFLFMAGAPSHLELFDNKPKLAEMDGKLPPKELIEGYRAAFINPN